MKKLIFIVVLVSYSIGSVAQEWSEEQTEIYNKIEGRQNAYKAKDFEEFLQSMHKNFSAWADSGIEFPVDKQYANEVWVQSEGKQYTMLDFKFEPLEIVITDNIAICYLKYVEKFMDNDVGREISVSGKLATTLIKENGQWLILANFSTHD